MTLFPNFSLDLFHTTVRKLLWGLKVQSITGSNLVELVETLWRVRPLDGGTAAGALSLCMQLIDSDHPRCISAWLSIDDDVKGDIRCISVPCSLVLCCSCYSHVSVLAPSTQVAGHEMAVKMRLGVYLAFLSHPRARNFVSCICVILFLLWLMKLELHVGINSTS